MFIERNWDGQTLCNGKQSQTTAGLDEKLIVLISVQCFFVVYSFFVVKAYK